MSKIKRTRYPDLVLAMTPDGTWHGLYIDGKLEYETDRFVVGDIVKALGGEVRVVKLKAGMEFPKDIKEIYR